MSETKTFNSREKALLALGNIQAHASLSESNNLFDAYAALRDYIRELEALVNEREETTI